jgi:hypothetical protein
LRGSSRIAPSWPLKAYLADSVAFRNGLLQIKGAAETLRYAAIATHGEIAEPRHFFHRAALLLPCVYQRTIVKINVKIVIRYTPDFHFKNESSGQAEELFPQGFKAWFSGAGARRSFGYDASLKKPAPAYGVRRKGFRVKPFFLRFVAQKVEPQSPMFKKVS